MNIIGIHSGHNASATLMIKGKVVGAFQEERFTGLKNQQGFPLNSVKALIRNFLKDDFNAIDVVVHASKELDVSSTFLRRYCGFSVKDHIDENYKVWKPYFYENEEINSKYWVNMYNDNIFVNINAHYDPNNFLTKSYKEANKIFNEVERKQFVSKIFNYSGKQIFADHHTCHAYYGYYGSVENKIKNDKKIVITADSFGDGKNWSVSKVNPKGVLELIASGSDNLTCRIYRFTTLILGMNPLEHEYKVMGLSAYSKSKKHIEKVIDIYNEILDFKDKNFVSMKPLKDSYFDLKDRLEGHRFDNIAAGLQEWSTSITKKWITFWMQETKTSELYFSGGLSMNVKTNGEILNDIKILNNLLVPASGGDETISIGACYWYAKNNTTEPVKHLSSMYLGARTQIEPNRDQYFKILQNYTDNISNFEIKENFTYNDIAQLLADNNVVARCVGKMEFGARSLGNRAILANPKMLSNVELINNLIKNRDFWMPFTPSFIEEKTLGYIQNPKNVSSPYMTIAFNTKEDARDDMKAVIHSGDKSTRPQFVSKVSNSEFFKIIYQFYVLTGIPCVLNTSLNLHGDPMNFTVEQSLNTFVNSGLKYIILDGDILVKKKNYEKNY